MVPEMPKGKEKQIRYIWEPAPNGVLVPRAIPAETDPRHLSRCTGIQYLSNTPIG